MQLWTHHPPLFDLTDPNLRLDWTKGYYWNYDQLGLRYRQILPTLHGLVGTNQFIWCYTHRACNGQRDRVLVEWELTFEPAEIIRFIHSRLWDQIVDGKDMELSLVFIDGNPTPGEGVHALVRVPLPPERARKHGDPEAARHKPIEREPDTPDNLGLLG
jgi:hypothetical protein